MVTKVYIKDNTKSPLYYLSDLDNFANGTEYIFKPGVNIIVGENGCGKTTLLKLIKKYLLVDFNECDKGTYNSNISSLYKRIGFLDGVDVYADYVKNTFRFSHYGEKTGEDAMSSFEDFGTLFDQKHASTGESVNIAIKSLFKLMFSKEAKLKYDYSKLKETYPEFINYVNSHKVECENEWTILMDEPDRNLSLENLEQIKGILSFHKPNTQLIAVIHNPLLIVSLAKDESINFIEMTKNYIYKVKAQIRNLLKK